MDEESQKEIRKFCDLIRHDINESKVDLVATSSNLQNPLYQPKHSQDLPEDHKYGFIDKDVFNKTLAKYEVMQNDKETRDTPVSCDIVGQNLSNHLQSRVGFHNFGSTTTLMKKLKIKEPNRYSILGGVSSLRPPRGHSLYELKKLANKADIKKCVVQGRLSLALGRPNDTKHLIDKGLEIDPDNADLYALKGSYHLAINELSEALSILTNVIQRRDLEDYDNAKKDLSDAHNKQGFTLMNRKVFNEAMYHFDQAARWNPNNDQAKYNIEFCRVQIEQSKPRSWGQPEYQTYRK